MKCGFVNESKTAAKLKQDKIRKKAKRPEIPVYETLLPEGLHF